MFGVGCPRPRPPPEYAPKSFHPVSSVISMTMLGFFCCCAAAGIFAIVTAANNAQAPRQTVLIMLVSSTLAAREGAAASPKVQCAGPSLGRCERCLVGKGANANRRHF